MTMLRIRRCGSSTCKLYYHLSSYRLGRDRDYPVYFEPNLPSEIDSIMSRTLETKIMIMKAIDPKWKPPLV